MRTSYSVAQKAGALMFGISLLWISFLGIGSACGQIARMQDWIDGLLKMSLSFALSLPAMFLLVLSWKLMRHEPTRDRIKNACGLLFGMSAFFLAFFVLWQVGVWLGRSPYPVDPILALFISIVIILPTNAGVARYVMRTSGIVPVKGEFVGKGSYMLLAFLLWAILSPICMDLFDKYQTDSLLDFGFVFGSFIIPYVFYRLVVKYWVRDTIAEQVALDYPSKDETLNDGAENP